jgi:hypothetical protein
MSDNHQDSTPSGSSTVRRETLSDKFPGLWTSLYLSLDGGYGCDPDATEAMGG